MKSDKIYKYLIIITLLTYGIFIGYSIIYGSFIMEEDETIYFNSARLFAETNSVRAPDCISEDVSLVFGTAWYGPLFHLLYGGVAKLAGSYTASFMIVNFASLVFAAALVAIKAKENKVFAVYFLLTLPPLLDLSFRFFPEILVLFFGAAIVTAWYNAEESSNESFFWDIGIFILLVWLLALFRVTLIFWIVGLWFLARDQRQKIFATLVIAASAFYIMVYMKYFVAPPWADGIKALDFLYRMDVSGFLKAISRTVYYNIIQFTNDSILYKALLIFVLAYIFIQHFRSGAEKIKIKFILTVAVVYLTAIIAMYTTGTYQFVKQTVVLFPGIILILNETLSQRRRVVIALSVFVIFLLHLPQNGKWMKQKSFMNDVYNNPFYDLKHSFQDIASVVDQGKENLILWSYDEWDYPSTAALIIPMSTLAKKPILYTSNVVPRDAAEDARFRQHGKQKIDYVLSRYPLSLSNLTLVFQNKHLFLYLNGK